MSFKIICNECGRLQEVEKMINNIEDSPKIIIDLTYEDIEDQTNDNILIQCLGCGNQFEF